MAEMADKLKNSNNRVKTLTSKLKAAEAEATDVDELIFRKDFTSPACILYSPLPNPESDHMILCVYQRCWDLSGRRILASLERMRMKKPETPSMTLLRLAGTLLGSCP